MHANCKAADTNRTFYGALWDDAVLTPPECFNTWPVVRALCRRHFRRLEIGPGLRPRLPLLDTTFLDLTESAVRKLRAAGARALAGDAEELPFADAAFDLICACDVIEHVCDDERALAEIARISAPDATLIISVPIHESKWTPFDQAAGHFRRYEPDAFRDTLRRFGFTIGRSATYGMQPKSSLLVNFGMKILLSDRKRAMWWYNRILMPIGLRLQKPLHLQDGLPDLDQLDQILLICTKSSARITSRFPLSEAHSNL